MTSGPGRAVAVVGAGRMGLGIAQVLAAAGFDVALQDPDAGARSSAHERAASIAGLLGQDPAPCLSRLRVAHTVSEALVDAALVIEAGPEDLALKQAIFAQVEELADPATVLATNTSGLRISDVGALMADPSRLVGAHFWHPPYLVPLVEVVEPSAAATGAVDFVCGLLRDAGLHPVRLRTEVPGFVGNRLQHALKREAIALVARGVCDAATLDTVVKFGFGLRLGVLGPLEQSDMIGLDLTLAIHESLMADLDVSPGPHPLLRRLVAEGKTGMDAGEGFRTWTPEQAAALRRTTTDHLVQAARQRAATTDRGEEPT